MKMSKEMRSDQFEGRCVLGLSSKLRFRFCRIRTGNAWGTNREQIVNEPLTDRECMGNEPRTDRERTVNGPGINREWGGPQPRNGKDKTQIKSKI